MLAVFLIGFVDVQMERNPEIRRNRSVRGQNRKVDQAKKICEGKLL